MRLFHLEGSVTSAHDIAAAQHMIRQLTFFAGTDAPELVAVQLDATVVPPWQHVSSGVRDPDYNRRMNRLMQLLHASC